jgi:hypothetical protein
MGRVADLRARAARGGWAAPLAAFLVALLVYAGAAAVADLPSFGDEPSYFLIAASIVEDGDIDLADQYADRDTVARACPGCPFPAVPAAFDYTGDGRLTPFHYPGLPLLIAPAVAVGGTYVAARIVVIVLSALAAALLFHLLRRIACPAWLRVLVWAAVVFCLPVVGYAGQLYPEMAGGLFILLAAWGLVARPSGVGRLTAGAAAAAFLPWLHVRFLPFALALVGLLIWSAMRLPPGSTRLTRAPFARAAVVALPLVGSLAVMAAAFWRWYGSPLPNAAYSVPQLEGLQRFDPAWAYQHVFGALLTPTFGLLPWAPVLVLALVGLGCAYRRSALWTCVAVAVGALYLVLSNGLGFTNAASLPARFQVPLVLILAVPLLILVVRAPPARVVLVPVAALSLALTGAGLHSAIALYPPLEGGEAVRVPLARTLAAVWPRFWIPQPASVAVGVQVREVGRLVSTPPLPVEAWDVAESTPEEGPGLLSGGSGTYYEGGRYEVVFTLGRTRQPGVRGEIGTVSVRNLEGRVIVARRLTDADVPADGQLHLVRVPVDLPGDELLWPEVKTAGNDVLRTGAILFAPGALVGATPPTRYPDVLLVLLWVAGISGLAVALAVRYGGGDAYRALRVGRWRL